MFALVKTKILLPRNTKLENVCYENSIYFLNLFDYIGFAYEQNIGVQVTETKGISISNKKFINSFFPILC